MATAIKIIDQYEAWRCMEEMGREAEFHGAMDGATRIAFRPATASMTSRLISSATRFTKLAR